MTAKIIDELGCEWTITTTREGPSSSKKGWVDYRYLIQSEKLQASGFTSCNGSNPIEVIERISQSLRRP